MHAVAVGANGNFGIASGQTFAVHAGAVLAQLICAQAGVELPDVGWIRMAVPHSWGICLRSILPFQPALRLMALSGSSLVGSPPWQLAQVKPFCACMSWLNFSWLTPSGSGRRNGSPGKSFYSARWPRRPRASGSLPGPRSNNLPLLREVAINGHTCHISKGKDSDSCDPLLGAGRVIPAREMARTARAKQSTRKPRTPRTSPSMNQTFGGISLSV